VVAGNIITGNATDGAGSGGQFGIIVDQGPHSNWIGVNTVYGPANPDEGNVIGGQIQGAIGIIREATNNVVAGNDLGIGRDGQPMGNGWGIALGFDAPNNTIGGTTAGAGNVIANNAGPGVWVIADATSTGERIVGNSIFNNAGLGIDLGGGYNL